MTVALYIVVLMLALRVRYQGDMSRPQRDLAVRAFMLKENVQVLLMSLKCGGVGLNLTRANRAFLRSHLL